MKDKSKLVERVAAAMAWAHYDCPEEFTPEQWFETYGVLSRRHAMKEAGTLLGALEKVGLTLALVKGTAEAGGGGTE